MNYPDLAQQIVSYLTPFLPYLGEMGLSAAKKIGERLTDASWDKAAALWDKLRHRKRIVQVAETFASMPENRGLRDALREEILQALTQDEQLAQDVAALMQDSVVQKVLATEKSRITNVKQQAKGNGNVRQDVTARGGSTVEGVQQVSD